MHACPGWESILRGYARFVLSSEYNRFPTDGLLDGAWGLPDPFPGAALMEGFVDPTLALEPVEGGEYLSGRERQLLGLRCGALDALWDGSPTKLASEGLPTGRSVVVLGDPGAGKTTLLRRLLLTRAQQLEATGEGPVPLLVSVRDLAVAWAQAQAAGLPVALESLLPVLAEQVFPGLGETIREVLEPGGPQLMLLLDGLDEAPVDVRSELVAEIERIVEAHRALAVVVTSRLAGYLEAPLPATFVQVVLRPLEENRWEAFLRTRLRAEGVVEEPETEARVRRFHRELLRRPELAELASLPLFMELLWTMVQRGRALPACSADLLEALHVELLPRWERLAQENSNARVPPVFRDYEAARALADSGRLPDELPHLVSDPARHRVLCLAAFCAGRGFAETTDVAAQVLARILDSGSAYERVLHRDLFLAARCLAGLKNPPQEVGGRIVLRLLEVCASSEPNDVRLEASDLLLRNTAVTLDERQMEEARRLFRSIEPDDWLWHWVDWLAFSRQPGREVLLGELTREKNGTTASLAWLALLLSCRSEEALGSLDRISDESPDFILRTLDEEYRETLCERLWDVMIADDPTTTGKAAVLLEQLGFPREQVDVARLESQSASRRASAAVRLLGTAHHVRALAELLEMCRSPIRAWRQEAIQVLLRTEAQEGTEALILEQLNSEDVADRDQAVKLLMKTRHRPFAETLLLLEGLSCPDRERRLTAAMLLLGGDYHAAGLQALVELALTADAEMRHRLFGFVLPGVAVGPEALRSLSGLLESEDPRARFACAAYLLDTVLRPEAEQTLLGLLTHEDAEEALLAGDLLHETEHRAAVEAQWEALMNHEKSDIRMQAAGRLLRTAAAERAERALIQEIRCGSPDAAYTPASWLDRRQLLPESQRELARMLGTHPSSYRMGIARLLGQQLDPMLILGELEKELRTADAWPPETVKPEHPHYYTVWLYARLATLT